MHRSAVLALALALVACDGAPPPEIDAAVPPDAFVANDAYVTPDAGFVIADHGPSYVIPDQGGTRIVHPELVLVTFANEPNRAVLEAHARWLMGSSWLTDVGAEYGVGMGSVIATVHRTDDAPLTTTSSDIEALLQAGVNDHSLPPGSDGSYASVLYVLYLPSTTTITDPSLGQSCVSYGGYHTEIANGGSPFAYAVIPNCHAFNPALSDLEFEEEAMSHELIEAATDARPMTHPAFAFPQSGFSYSPWLFVGPEVADLCALHVGPTAYVRDPSGFIATRVWSNAAAMANDRDPCVPIPTGVTTPYFSIPIAPNTAQLAAPGASTTFDITGWSTGRVRAFGLYAEASMPGPGMFTPTVSVDRTSLNNGDHATLTVGVPAGTPSGAYALIYVETYQSTMDYDSQPVVVFTP